MRAFKQLSFVVACWLTFNSISVNADIQKHVQVKGDKTNILDERNRYTCHYLVDYPKQTDCEIWCVFVQVEYQTDEEGNLPTPPILDPTGGAKKNKNKTLKNFGFEFGFGFGDRDRDPFNIILEKIEWNEIE